MLRDNPKEFWKFIFSQNNDRSVYLMDENGSPVCEANVSSAVNEYFSSVFTVETENNFPLLCHLDLEPMTPIEISPAGISKLIERLKPTSSCGRGYICSKMFANTKVILSSYLHLLFAQSLSQSRLPADWKLGRVVTVFKAAIHSLVSNYRQISLTCIASKLLEHVLFLHIASHLEFSNIFYNHQHGFRKGYSCET